MGQGTHRHLGLGARRDSVVNILQAQLERGTKPVKKQPGKFTTMTSGDVDKINKQLIILSGPILKYRRKNRKYKADGSKLSD